MRDANCLGKSRRETGHSREPSPPHKIIGEIAIDPERHRPHSDDPIPSSGEKKSTRGNGASGHRHCMLTSAKEVA